MGGAPGHVHAVIDPEARRTGAGIPSSAELLCRYVLGLRFPDLDYLKALESYLDERYLPGMGYKVTSFLEWLDPLGEPLSTPPHPRGEVAVEWLLTASGVSAVRTLLAPSMGELRVRRPSRTALVALAILGAVDQDATAEHLAAAVATVGIDRAGRRGWRVDGRAAGPAQTADLVRSMENAEPSFATQPWLHARFSWPIGSDVLDHSLAQLAHRNLVRRIERRIDPVVTAGVVRPRHIDALRAMVRRGDVRLSPLARGLLMRRIDRRPKVTGGTEHGPMADARVLRTLAAAQLRAAEGKDIACLAEQVVLRHPARSFSPGRSGLAPAQTGSEHWATRRVDLALWSERPNTDLPALLVELERPNTSTHVFDRVRSHIEGAMALSATGAARVDVCFVAHSAVRERVVATVAGFRDQFRMGAASAWSEAEVGIRVVPLGRARREGLDRRSGDFSTEFQGRHLGTRPAHPTSPVAFLARSA